MKSYRIAVSRRTDADADSIYDWLAHRSLAGATRWFLALRTTLRGLTENPESHSRAPEADTVGRDIRQALFKTRRGRIYRVLFVVVDDTVHVVSIRGYGQDLATLDDLELPN